MSGKFFLRWNAKEGEKTWKGNESKISLWFPEDKNQRTEWNVAEMRKENKNCALRCFIKRQEKSFSYSNPSW